MMLPALSVSINTETENMMREHEFLTPREQALLMKLLVANYSRKQAPDFLENDEIFEKTKEVIGLYKVIGYAVTDIAKILSRPD